MNEASLPRSFHSSSFTATFKRIEVACHELISGAHPCTRGNSMLQLKAAFLQL